MRRLAVIPFALLFGCWDFPSLTGTDVQQVIDLSIPGDIACAKTPNTLQEDCTKNEDINNNCLVGCEDPTCYDHVACFASKGYKSYGVLAASTCANGAPTPVFQTLNANPANCNGSCMPNTATGTCASTLHVYADKKNCDDKTNDAKVTLAEGAKCPNVTSVKDSWYAVDKPTAAGCTPKNATVPLNASWGTSQVYCDQSASMLTRFSNMKSNGVQCVMFTGTDISVCASTQIYTKGSVYYLGTTGSSTCTCSATAMGGCALTNGATNLVTLTDKVGCGMTTNTTALPAENVCMQAKDPANLTFQTLAVSTNLAAPTCNVAGAVSGGFMPRDGFTLCCM